VAVGFAWAALLVAAIAWYAVWTAGRLDRLHRRVDAAAAALDGQLRRRAETAARFAAQRRRGTGELTAAAAAALHCDGLGHDREQVENALSRAITSLPRLEGDLLDEATRAAFARRFYNDTVRDVLVVRRRRIVRYLRLAGHAPLPAFFELDEPALDRRTIDG
jgi:hypothetical protein